MRILGAVKNKFRKILKLTFTGSVANELSTAPSTVFLLGPNVSVAGTVLNLNGSSDCFVKVTQLGDNDWFNLQRDFDLTFDLVINPASSPGEIIAFEDGPESSVFRLTYFGFGSGLLQVNHFGSPNTDSGISSAVTLGVNLPIKIEYRRTSVKLFVNGVVVINATGWSQRPAVPRDLWLGGSWSTNTIQGSLDNVEMTLFL